MLSLAWAVSPGIAQEKCATVLSISDGDTIRLLEDGKRITVQLIPQTIDRYGRTVAEVIGAVNLKLAMVDEGQAFAHRKSLGQCNTQKYLDAEARASRRRIGMRQVSGGITRPWEFRRMRASSRSGGAS